MARPSPSDAAAAPLALRLVTLNVNKGFTSFRRFVLHELREAIADLGADLVFLQEVIGSHAAFARKHPRWPDQPQYQFLANRQLGNYAYGRNAVYSEGHHGNAVLSTFAIAHWRNHDVSVGGAERRGLLHCVVDVPSLARALHLICVHLALKTEHRHQQLLRLRTLIEAEVPTSSPLIIAGDFNDWSNRAAAILAPCQGLREIFTERHGAPARSFPAQFPLLRLDRVYVRNVTLCDAQVLTRRPWSRLSDHAALSADIALARA